MSGFCYLKNVITLNLNSEACIGCGRCVEVCPHGVLAMDAKKVHIVERDRCMECGACQNNCPTEAIETAKGVGCAQAVITGVLRRTEPTCDCSNSCCG